MLVTGGIYARTSSEKQSETSIEDQIRRCKELAEHNGWTVPDELIFTDTAVSGTAAGDHRRDGYRAFLKAWEAGAFDVFIVDDSSRLSRDAVEQAKLMRRLEENRRVRMVTVDGIDTQDDDWQLRLGLQVLLAQQDIRKLQHFVGRGMQGKLERGYMIATPAYGYDYKRIYDDREKHIGTHWIINKEKAAIVRRVFEMREQGSSLHQIAAWLNSEGVPTAREPLKETSAFWRPSRVRNLLMNTVYRGAFVLHGSTTHRYRANKRGEDVMPTVYQRPELRLVSDETWHRCNQNTHSRSRNGSGKHFLTGLLSCGCCGGTLVLNAEQERRSMYCAACTIKNGVHPGEARLTSTIRTEGVTLLLKHALALFLTPSLMDAFRNSLSLRLTGGPQQEVEECQKELRQWGTAQQRLSRMLQALTDDDPVLESRYHETRQKVAKAETRLSHLNAKRTGAETRVEAAQQSANPSLLLDGLLESHVPAERLRSLLAKLLPRIVFLGKIGRYTSFFKVQFPPGAVLSMATETETVNDGALELMLKLYYKPDNRSGSGGWTVTVESNGDPSRLRGLHTVPCVE